MILINAAENFFQAADQLFTDVFLSHLNTDVTLAPVIDELAALYVGNIKELHSLRDTKPTSNRYCVSFSKNLDEMKMCFLDLKLGLDMRCGVDFLLRPKS